jgi:predicted HicB family RNase H-like nuclease
VGNVIETDGHKSVVSFDREIAMCRREFRGFFRVSDFNDRDMKELESEGRISLEVHLEVCRETGMRPLRAFSVEFNARLDPGLHQVAKIAAAANSESVNDWVAESKEAAAS